MALKRLTIDQRNTILFMINFRAQFGRYPTFSEIRKQFFLKTKTAVWMRLQPLVKKGYLDHHDKSYTPTREGVIQLRKDGDKPERIIERYSYSARNRTLRAEGEVKGD